MVSMSVDETWWAIRGLFEPEETLYVDTRQLESSDTTRQ